MFNFSEKGRGWHKTALEFRHTINSSGRITTCHTDGHCVSKMIGYSFCLYLKERESCNAGWHWRVPKWGERLGQLHASPLSFRSRLLNMPPLSNPVVEFRAEQGPWETAASSEPGVRLRLSLNEPRVVNQTADLFVLVWPRRFWLVGEYACPQQLLLPLTQFLYLRTQRTWKILRKLF